MVLRDSNAGQASFLDMVEVYMAAKLLELVEVRALREQLRRVAEIIGVDGHPLAQLKVLENATILVPRRTDDSKKARVLYFDDSETVTDLSSGGNQLALYDVVRAHATNVDFDAHGIASKLWPFGQQMSVVIDPRVAFGSPILDGTRVRTSEIAALVEAEQGDLKFVAKLYGLSTKEVQAAVDFETPGAVAA